MRAFFLAVLALLLTVAIIWFRLLPEGERLNCTLRGGDNMCWAVDRPASAQSESVLASRYFSGTLPYKLVAASDFEPEATSQSIGCTFVLVKTLIAQDTPPPKPRPGGFGGIWRATPINNKGWVVDPLEACATIYPDDLWFLLDMAQYSGGWYARDAGGRELHLFYPGYQLAAVLRLEN